MTHRTTGWVLALGAGALAACAAPREDAGSWRHDSPPSWRLTRESAEHRTETLRTQDGAPLPPDLGPRDYVRLALARNPSLRAAEHRVAMLGERVPQVESLDDPMLTVAPIGEMAETAAGQVGLMTGLSQRLPYPGKRAARGRVAEQEAAAALRDLDRARLAVARDTLRAWWTLYETARSREVIQADRALLERFQQIAEAAYSGGAGTQQDLLRASVELSNLDEQLLNLGQRQDTARALLNQLLDRPVDAPLPEPPPVPLQTRRLDLDRLLGMAAAWNPSLRQLEDLLQADRERMELARLDRWPDLTVGLNWNMVQDRGMAPMADGTDQWWLGFGVNLPVFTARRDAAEREAEQRLWSRVAALTDQRNTVAFRVQDALGRFQTQQRRALLFRDVILPQARQTVDAAASAYRAGGVEFLTLVDNWRKLLEFDLLYHQSVAGSAQALADLEQVVGHALDDPPSSPEEEE